MTTETRNELIAPPGLKGLIVADTAVGDVRGGEGYYHYRQHNALDIARHHSLEAAAALLIDGELPDAPGEAAFRAELATRRAVDPAILAALEAALVARERSGGGPITPLAGLRAALSVLAGDVPTIDQTPAERRSEALRIVAAVPTVLAALHRLGTGQAPLVADPALGHAADYLRMATGATPAPALARAVETYLVLTADHGFNNSTFTARVVTSAGASVGAAMTAAVGSLSGPLHGGAPSRVLDMLDDIGDPERTEAWAGRQLAAGRPVMGFGHAVYRAGDPRSELLKQVALDLAGPLDTDLVERAVAIEERMLRVLARHRPEAVIVTNVEFYAAVVLHLAGLPQEMFTPTFTTSRSIGWAAHVLEQAAANKIMRPSARYTGPAPSL